MACNHHLTNPHQPHDHLAHFRGLLLSTILIHPVQLQRHDPDAQGDLFLFLQLFLGLCHLLSGILYIAHALGEEVMA